jgi:hypothetical protein
VRLLELRQGGGEEQTRRCRRRSISPRLKRSKGRHSRFPPTKANQKRHILAQREMEKQGSVCEYSALSGGDFQGIKVYRPMTSSPQRATRKKDLPRAAEYRLDEASGLSLSMVASLQYPPPFRLARSS